MRAKLRAPLGDLAPGIRELPGDVARYVARVHRLRVGDELTLFDARARLEASAEVVRADGDRVGVVVGEVRPASVVSTRAVTWIHALPKGDKADAIVADATELGATRIAFVSSARAVVRLDPARATSRVARWTKLATEAARQCGRGDVPEIAPVGAWHDAIDAAPKDAERFCLYERAVEPIGPSLRGAVSSAAPLVFCVGPEGGLQEAEVRAAADAGFRIVSLGELVLRTETVCAAVLGAVRFG